MELFVVEERCDLEGHSSSLDVTPFYRLHSTPL